MLHFWKWLPISAIHKAFSEWKLKYDNEKYYDLIYKTGKINVILSIVYYPSVAGQVEFSIKNQRISLPLNLSQIMWMFI